MALSLMFLLVFALSLCSFFTSIEGRFHGLTKQKYLHIISKISLPPSPVPALAPVPAPAPAPAPQAASPSYIASSPSPEPSSVRVFDVLSFGAVGDGASEDTQAFKMAWDAACQTEFSVLLAPVGYSFMILPTIFTGPCKNGLVFQVIMWDGKLFYNLNLPDNSSTLFFGKQTHTYNFVILLL